MRVKRDVQLKGFFPPALSSLSQRVESRFALWKIHDLRCQFSIENAQLINIPSRI